MNRDDVRVRVFAVDPTDWTDSYLRLVADVNSGDPSRPTVPGWDELFDTTLDTGATPIG